ncbi:MAG: PKD domain-containing protein [Bacteroidales bacterium]|nr:PKD domain-containing protein [Bacteroidales bacterium]
MRILIFFLCLFLISIYSIGQDCSITAKANRITPDKLCSPVAVNWLVSYTGVTNAGSSVGIQFDWDDGRVETLPATAVSAGSFQVTATHSYTSTGDKCNYRPKSTLVVNGVLCTSSTQEQIVTVWDDDDHNGGHMHIHPEVYPICFGNSANVRFQDLTQFNCVPPQEEDVPNLYTRWIQWIYGTEITMTGTPVTINGTSVSFPLTTPIITLQGPVTGSGVYSDVINVASDKLIGEFFQVTLRNWNYCNPYDDPDIPGPPANPANGDHPPVVTTAIILIVPYPDATITPVDTLCVKNAPVILRAHDQGGTWSGTGVTGNSFDPSLAGPGDHVIKYEITSRYGCTESDQITITVMPSPTANINPVGNLYVTDPKVVLTASPPGGTWSGNGVVNNTFDPLEAGTGKHVITYQTLPDRFGCSGIDTININVLQPPLPGAYFKPDTVGCTPLSVQFRNMSTHGESYLWDFGDKTYSTEKNPVHIYYVPGNYIVTLTVTNYSGESTFKGLIKVYQNPTASFNVYPSEVIYNSQVVVFQNYSMYGVSWFWNFGDGGTSVEENPWHKYEANGRYDVSLIVTSKEGCTDSAKYISPIIVEYKTGEIVFPNAFRWNKTGTTGGYWKEYELNDYTFHPFFTNVIEYHLMIFNRWGVLIYESNDLYKGWDGYFGSGNLAVQGVYVWNATGRYADGVYFTKVGDVTFLH